MLSNAYLLAKIRFDTAENEPAKKLQNVAKFGTFAKPAYLPPRGLVRGLLLLQQGRGLRVLRDGPRQLHRRRRRRRAERLLRLRMRVFKYENAFLHEFLAWC